MRWLPIPALAAGLCCAAAAQAQTAAPAASPPAPQPPSQLPSQLSSQPPPLGAEAVPGTFLLTVFLRHDQSKTVDEINEHLKATGWYDKFPGAGVEIVSWYVMMGVGQVVTLRVPAERLRDVNRIIEGAAWGGYRTEFYPTYDYRGLWEEAKRRARQ